VVAISLAWFAFWLNKERASSRLPRD